VNVLDNQDERATRGERDEALNDRVELFVLRLNRAEFEGRAAQAAERVEKWAVGPIRDLQARPGADFPARVGQARAELRDEARFADARVARDEDEPTM